MDAINFFPERGEDPRIVLISVERSAYYLLEGEEFLNDLLLADGKFPKPVRVIHFDSAFAVRVAFGQDVQVGSLWGIHPEIIARLRREDDLLEVEAEGRAP